MRLVVFLFFSSFFNDIIGLLCGGLMSLIWGSNIRKSVPRDLLLLGYIILQMAQRKKWDPKRMKAATEVVRNKEMGSCKASRVIKDLQFTGK
jgi:hypothetical protein